MEDKQCFTDGCKLDVEYICPCCSPDLYICKFHAANHLQDSDKIHSMKSIFGSPCEEAREAILKFLAKVESKHNKLKQKILASFSQGSFDAESDLKELMKEINSYSDELNNCFTKISQTSRIKKPEQDPVLGLLNLQPSEAIEKVKVIIPPSSDWCDSAQVFCEFTQKIEKMIECFIKDKFEGYLDNRLAKIESTLELHDKSISLAIGEIANVKDFIPNVINKSKKNLIEFEDWKGAVNMKIEEETNLLSSSIAEDPKVENQNDISAAQNLRDTISEACNRPSDADLEQDCKTYESNPIAHITPPTQFYQDYAETYHLQASLFNLMKKDDRTTLLIYNTETETKQEKTIQTSEALDWHSCITQLPSDKLFCYGKGHPYSGITLIIDENGAVQELPSGTPCFASSAIYFNSNVYCFGGYDTSYPLTLSSRFDLDRNEWIELAPLPKMDYYCSSIIFNGDILISGWINMNLVRYSIDNNSFTTIPYEFAYDKGKILINGERLYLIECENRSVYESEIGSDTTWRWISDSTISLHLGKLIFHIIKEKYISDA